MSGRNLREISSELRLRFCRFQQIQTMFIKLKLKHISISERLRYYMNRTDLLEEYFWGMGVELSRSKGRFLIPTDTDCIMGCALSQHTLTHTWMQHMTSRLTGDVCSCPSHQYHVTCGDVHVGVGGLLAPGRDAAPGRGADGRTGVAELRGHTVDPGGDRLRTLRGGFDGHALPAQLLQERKGGGGVRAAASLSMLLTLRCQSSREEIKWLY